MCEYCQPCVPGASSDHSGDRGSLKWAGAHWRPSQLAVTLDSGFEMTCQAVYWVIRGRAGRRN